MVLSGQRLSEAGRGTALIPDQLAGRWREWLHTSGPPRASVSGWRFLRFDDAGRLTSPSAVGRRRRRRLRRRRKRYPRRHRNIGVVKGMVNELPVPIPDPIGERLAVERMVGADHKETQRAGHGGGHRDRTGDVTGQAAPSIDPAAPPTAGEPFIPDVSVGSASKDVQAT